jgi:hypothetical protein
MTFTTDPTGSIKRLPPSKFGKWVYTAETGTKLNYVEYDPTVPTTKKKTFQTTHPSAGNNVILEMSSDADCAITTVANSAFDIVQIHPGNNTMPIINAYSTVIADFSTYANVLIEANRKQIKAGSGCWAFRLGAFIYLKNNAGTAFTKLATSASVGFANAVYDKNMKFALAGNTVYKFSNGDYASAFTVDNLGATREIFASADENKLLIVSHNPVSVPAGTVQRISGSAKLFAYNGSTWNPVSVNFEFNNVLQSYPPFTLSNSPNFETFGLAFQNTTASRTVKPFLGFFQVDYEKNTSLSYDLPPEFSETYISQVFVIFGNILYYQKFVVLDNFYVQYFYKFNPATKKIVEIGRDTIDSAFARSLKGG